MSVSALKALATYAALSNPTALPAPSPANDFAAAIVKSIQFDPTSPLGQLPPAQQGPCIASNAEALALSRQDPHYGRPGNLVGGEIKSMQTPQGEIVCRGGDTREITGRDGAEGQRRSGLKQRACHFLKNLLCRPWVN